MHIRICDSMKEGKKCGKTIECNTLIKVGNCAFDICKDCRKTTTIADLEELQKKQITMVGLNA